MNANDRQVGGGHYQARTQTWDHIIDNNMGFLTGSIISYLVRWERKGNPQDLEKVQHYLDKLKQSIDEGRVVPTGGPQKASTRTATEIRNLLGMERGPLPNPCVDKVNLPDADSFRSNRQERRNEELSRVIKQNEDAAKAS